MTRVCASLLAGLCITGCLDNAGPEDRAAERLEVVSAPAGPALPTDTLPQTIVVKATTFAGRPAAGVQVTWSSDASGSFVPATSVTDRDGLVRAVWVLGEEPRAQTAVATVTGTEVRTEIPMEVAVWRVAQIASGGSQHCAVDVVGATFCWDTFGDGRPVPVAAGLQFTSIAVGGHHACGVTSTGRVYCWGSNSFGQLGDGTVIDRADAVEALLPPGARITTLSAGGNQSCAIDSDAVAYCWGMRAFSSTEPAAVPIVVPGGLTWRTISAGIFGACGIESAGQVYCWGSTVDAGGTAFTSEIPTLVGPLPSFQTVLAGFDGHCGIVGRQMSCWATAQPVSVLSNDMLTMTGAGKPMWGLGGDGRGYSWGGITNSTIIWSPSIIPFEGSLRLRAVSGNDYRPCGIEVETSGLYCWQEHDFPTGRVSGPGAVPPPAWPPSPG